ncbi:MAG: sensor histidine kinase [Bacteroidales bacterium]|nr:sensor histidine kinase [Bacteroidales bacterium]
MNRKTRLWLIAFVSMMLFGSVSTFVFISDGGFEPAIIFRHFLFNLPVVIGIAAVDVRIVHTLSKRAPALHKRYMYELLLSVIFIVSVLGLAKVAHVADVVPGLDYDPLQLRVIIPAVFTNFIILMLVESFINQEHIARMKQEQAEFQLMALKAQINPHFLFNSLNVLSSLTYQSPEMANRFTKKLAQVYRYLLDSAKERAVPLRDEVAFTQNYIYLQQIRHQNGLTVDSDLEESDLGQRLVIPTSLQMAIENAIKHNVVSSRAPLHISIRDMGTVIRIENNIQLKDHVESHGIGLQNLDRQLSYYNLALSIHNDGKVYRIDIPTLKEARE